MNLAYHPFGSTLPYAEPSWYRGLPSPYYNQSHIDFRAKVREFVEEELRPYVDQWEEDHVTAGTEMPLSVIADAARRGIYAPQLPASLGGTPPPGGCDMFHELILHDELSRCGSMGVAIGFAIYTMALPPIVNHASEYIKNKVIRDVLEGRKFISLCISEPTHGSDVAGIRTSALRHGDHYIVNGQKKWITFGIHADFFTVAVRTGKKGMGGLSLVLIERDMPGVSVQRMRLQGSWCAGTSVVTFEDVKVPVKNLIGDEGKAFKYIVTNFNHERWVIAIQANRIARQLIEESYRYASKRQTFGKTLIEHQVIRHKLADMSMRVEAVHSMIETISYQMQQNAPADVIGGAVAFLKVMATKTFELCARESAQIFGGASYVRGGQGQWVERAYREVRGAAIPGGSEEILMDLGMKQAMRQAAKM